MPGGSAIRTQQFYCCGPGSIPGQRIKIPQALWNRPKKEKLSKLINYFKNGSIVNLQCCVSFRYTAKWFSHLYLSIYYGSVQFSHSVMSNSLRYHELQYARPPCPSQTPGVHSDSRPSSQWCHPAISSSFVPFSSSPQSLPASAGSLKKQESSRKTFISALLTMPKPLTVWITINCGKFWKRWEYQNTWPASWETYMQVRKQQLELDMEQQTGSK